MGCISSIQPTPKPGESPAPSLATTGGPAASLPGALRPPALQMSAAADSTSPSVPPSEAHLKESAISAAEKVARSPNGRKILQQSQPGLAVDEAILRTSMDDFEVTAQSLSSGLIFADVSSSTQSTTVVFGLIKKGDLAALRTLVDDEFMGDRRRIHVLQGMWSSTPLLVAAQYQHKHIIQWLLEQPPSPEIVNLANEKGATPLLYAAMEGFAEVVEQLLQLGAIADLPPSKEAIYNASTDQSLVCTPLSIAIINDHKPVVGQLLHAGVPVDQPFTFPAIKSTLNKASKGITGLTPILLCCALAHDNILRDLVHRGAKCVHKDDENSNAAHLLARASTRPNISMERVLACWEVLRSLVSYDLLAQCDSKGETPLFAALQGKDVQFVRCLLEEGSNAAAVNPLTGMDALQCAAKRKNLELVALLLEYGADPLAACDWANKSLPAQSELTQLLQTHAQAWLRVRDMPQNPAISAASRSTAPDSAVSAASELALQDVIESEAARLEEAESPVRDSKGEEKGRENGAVEGTTGTGGGSSSPVARSTNGPDQVQFFAMDESVLLPSTSSRRVSLDDFLATTQHSLLDESVLEPFSAPLIESPLQSLDRREEQAMATLIRAISTEFMADGQVEEAKVVTPTSHTPVRPTGRSSNPRVTRKSGTFQPTAPATKAPSRNRPVVGRQKSAQSAMAARPVPTSTNVDGLSVSSKDSDRAVRIRKQGPVPIILE